LLIDAKMMKQSLQPAIQRIAVNIRKILQQAVSDHIDKMYKQCQADIKRIRREPTNLDEYVYPSHCIAVQCVHEYVC